MKDAAVTLTPAALAIRSSPQTSELQPSSTVWQSHTNTFSRSRDKAQASQAEMLPFDINSLTT